MTVLLRDIQANPLSALILATLIIGELGSLLLMARKTSIPVVKNWHAGVLALWAALGLPAVLDLLQTSGAPLAFASVVFAALALTIIVSLLNFIQKSPQALVAQWYAWAIPVLVVGGLVVAGYLMFVDVTATAPVCGPVVSGCHVVQASPYSKLFGVLPISLMGLIGYAAVLAGWFMWQWGPAPLRKTSGLVIWVICFFGVLFSAYLTYLELVVIGATCVWCITSAVLMLLLLWVSTPAAQLVFVVSDDEA